MTIRAGRTTLSASVPEADGGVRFEPYVMRSGVSVAANLREALKTMDIFVNAPKRVRLIVDTPVLMTPVELFSEESADDFYHHSFPDSEGEVTMHNVIPDLNAVALFSVNKDLKLVVEDNFSEVRYMSAMIPVWRHLHRRSYTGNRRKLYAYFHEERMEVFSFQPNRFRFCNSFEVKDSHDALFFLIYTWRQLQLDTELDELHLVGDAPDSEWLTAELRRFLHKVMPINVKADFNGSPICDVKGMPYDLMTYYVKRR